MFGGHQISELLAPGGEGLDALLIGLVAGPVVPPCDAQLPTDEATDSESDQPAGDDEEQQRHGDCRTTIDQHPLTIEVG